MSLRERAPAGDEVPNEELELLEEAETMFGPSPVLRYERNRFRPAAGADDLPPRTAWDHYALGRVLLDDGQTERAAAELEQAVALQPQGFWPNFYAGVCAYRRGHYTDTKTFFRVCTALAPGAAPCYYNHGLAQAALGRPDRARADYDRALQLDPGMGPAWLNRGVLDYQEKREDEALKDLLQRVRKAPTGSPSTTTWRSRATPEAKTTRPARKAPPRCNCGRTMRGRRNCSPS